MPDGQDSNDSTPAIERKDNAVTLDSIFQESFELTLQWLAQGRAATQRTKRSLDASFHLRREMPDNLGNARWYLGPIPGH
jgi:hypothetical protein